MNSCSTLIFSVLQISTIPSLLPFPRSRYCLDTYYLVPFLVNKGCPCGFPCALFDTRRCFNVDDASLHILWETVLSFGRMHPKELLYMIERESCHPADDFLPLITLDYDYQ